MYQESNRVGRRNGGWSLNGLWQVLKRGWRRLLPRPGGVYYVGGSDLLPPLDRQEERRLLLALREGDEQARDTLIEHNLRLVVYLARRFENTGINLDDLVSIGTIGLIKAVNTFDTEKNIKLATYAARCIENEILMHLRKSSNQRTEISFDEPLNTDWDGNELLLSDILGTEEDLVERPVQAGEDRRLLYQALEKLNEREKRIITMRFGLDGRDSRTQKEVADCLGISQSYISRLEKRIIGRLKKEFSRIG
ncbi:MAG: RNA polymerase sporulation sigma factor SigE [Clostridiales bacterium]|nr:RNA polymerase sporulation sigma factor SigE [Clostridiales bacterium]